MPDFVLFLFSEAWMLLAFMHNIGHEDLKRPNPYLVISIECLIHNEIFICLSMFSNTKDLVTLPFVVAIFFANLHLSNVPFFD
jgi:hypothetical protein